MYFKQVKYRGDNFSYVIADEKSKEAIIVDPAFNSDMLTGLLKDLGFTLMYIIDTHGHTDHISGNSDLKKSFPRAKIVAHKLANFNTDMHVSDGDLLHVGGIRICVLYTPGHTKDGICLLIDGKVLTGDTLFVGECGRIDLPGSSAEELYRSLFDKLAKLDDDVEVYPGHDYGSASTSTIGRERQTNYVLKKRTLAEFLEFMGSS